jgi:hypothetical protein
VTLELILADQSRIYGQVNVAGPEIFGHRVGAGITVVGGKVETEFLGDEVNVTKMAVVGLLVRSGAVVLLIRDCMGGEEESQRAWWL